MVASIVPVPQSVIDEHAMVAQTYAGFLLGHPIRAARYTTPLRGSVEVDWSRPWVEPNPLQDDCVFCVRLTDEEAVRRVEGFQWAIDKEVIGAKGNYFNTWMEERGLSYETPEGRRALLRTFIAETQYKPIPEHQSHWNNSIIVPARPNGWKTKAAPLVNFPLRLKRKMCIDWNHVYTRWMEKEGLHYNFDDREFYKELDVSQEFYAAWMEGC